MRRHLDRLRRTAPGPLLVRAIVFLSAAAGLWIAAPAQFSSFRFVLPILIIAGLPALVPGGRSVGYAMVAIVAAWILSTLAFGEEAGVARTFAAASALYLTHSAAALAAMLPYDAIVDGRVLLRWAARTGMVLASAGGVTGLVVWVVPRLTPSGSLAILIAGLAVVAALIALLSWSSGVRSSEVRRRL